MRGAGAIAAVLAIGLLISQAQTEPPGTQEDLPRPPAGEAWKLVWHDGFLVDYVRVYDLE